MNVFERVRLGVIIHSTEKKQKMDSGKENYVGIRTEINQRVAQYLITTQAFRL
jgi:hypothetical protein